MSAISIATDRSVSITIPSSLAQLFRRIAAMQRLRRYPMRRGLNRVAAMRWLDMYVEHRR
ncbi:MAG: hypothetical protein ABIQ30_16755 [Devosia sp.]